MTSTNGHTREKKNLLERFMNVTMRDPIMMTKERHGIPGAGTSPGIPTGMGSGPLFGIITITIHTFTILTGIWEVGTGILVGTQFGAGLGIPGIIPAGPITVTIPTIPAITTILSGTILIFPVEPPQKFGKINSREALYKTLALNSLENPQELQQRLNN